MSNDRVIISSDIVWRSTKPRFNAWQTGHGAHQNKKRYSRSRAKEALRKELLS